MKKNTLPIITIIVILFISLSFYYFKVRERTAFVYVSQVMEEYQRMEHAKIVFDSLQQNTNKRLQAELHKFEKEKSAYETYKKKLSDNEQVEMERKLMDMQIKCNKMTQQVNKKAGELRRELFNPVIEEINSFIAEYGRLNNYNYVFGNLGTGNIMYASESNDITHEIIEALNNQYQELLDDQE
jgi:outer membrane protein